MRKEFKKIVSDQQGGYILVATIVLGLAISIVSVALLQVIAVSSQTLNSVSYQAIAKEAAMAGTTYADGCVASSSISWSSLTPLTDCTGTSSGGSQYLVQNTDWRSKFNVSAPTISNGKLSATSTGTVEQLFNGATINTYTATSKITEPSVINSFPVATGQVLTDIKNDANDCAIANGKLYCWGDNTYGQLGRGYTGSNAANATPTVVGGALANKTVTKVSVAYSDVCAIADGTPYCWGQNSSGQLGDGTSTDKNIPTANVPITSSGPLSGQNTVEISTASMNDPASVIWPFATAFPHTCALTSDGSVSCWGDGGFRQNTGGGCDLVFGICTGFYTYPSPSTPTLTVGYTGGGQQLSGIKSEHIGAASHDSCSAAQGKLICWGVQAPIALWCNSVLFSEAYETVVPYNPCVSNYSNGYDTGTLAGSALSGQFIDSNLWDISSDEGCFMANTNLDCFGTTPAFDLFWSGGWGAPWTAETNADVTDADNGDDVPSTGIIGLFCIIDRGVAKCSATPLDGYSGTGTSGYQDFEPLITTSGLSGKTPTKIGAGQDHGCVIANGELLCWGNGTGGVLADGNINIHAVSYATLSANSTIGATDGTYAAHSSIDVGTNFACGLVNGHVYCWGENGSGQLGMGNTTDLSQPRAVPSLYNSVATKVSTGANHTCAIVYGQLYCWGDNSFGQLGIGSTGGIQNTPQLIGGLLANKRVTDVSTGANSTCAVANGQAYCWGSNGNGQVGIGSTAGPQNTPQLVNGHGALTAAMDTTAVTVGTSYACAIANADAYCWGLNTNGQLGDGTLVQKTSPVLLSTGTAGLPAGPNGTRPMVSALSAGSDFTCGIFNGTASCWGDNTNGQTGQATIVGNTTKPTALSGAAGGYYATAVSAGGSHACAILDGNLSAKAGNGNLYCWGSAANGRLGNNTTSPNISTATLINGGDAASRSTTNIAAGMNSTCSISNGDILCWGAGANGEIGNGGINDKLVPTITASYIQLGAYAKGIIY